MKLLRPARREDFAEFNRIAKQVNDLHAQWGLCESVDCPYPMDFFLDMVENEEEINEIYIAEKGGKIVGYIRFYIWDTNGTSVTRRFLSIDDIGVDETLRNQGIGQQMIDDLHELANNEGCTDFQLYVDAHNEGALSFYKKCGFHISNIGMQTRL